MVWKEYMDEVTIGLRSTAPVPGLTQKAVFRALTEARHELQMETGLCHMKMDLDLSVKMDQTTGIVNDGGLVNIIDRAELFTTDGLNSRPVGVVDQEAFEAFVRQGQIDVTQFAQQYQFGQWQTNADILSWVAIICVTDDGLMIWPFSGLVGTLRLRYQPRLKPYADSETEQYPNFATDFVNQVKNNGLEQVFDTGGAQRGMIARAKMLLVSRVPDIANQLKSEMGIWAAEWQRAVDLMEKNNPSLAMRADPKPYFVPVS